MKRSRLGYLFPQYLKSSVRVTLNYGSLRMTVTSEIGELLHVQTAQQVVMDHGVFGKVKDIPEKGSNSLSTALGHSVDGAGLENRQAFTRVFQCRSLYLLNVGQAGLKHSARRFGAPFSAAAKSLFFYCVRRCVGAAPTVSPCIQSFVNKIWRGKKMSQPKMKRRIFVHCV